MEISQMIKGRRYGIKNVKEFCNIPSSLLLPPVYPPSSTEIVERL
jgi:hypothetical protein